MAKGKAWQGLWLSGAVILVCAGVILPFPPLFLDFLLAANLLVSLVLLLVSLSVTDALRLSTLPTILLLAALSRLALDVSTTRAILGGKNPGDIVESFGRFVTGSDLTVGLVVFLMITVIQLVVIAKGAERVAEVSARFALDALPGRQMTIDADLRAGLVDPEGARRRRGDLQAESKFYGSLDGAMKFVKGDAVASLIVAGVNMAGGLAVGVFRDGSSPADAFSRYALLTVGAGLLSQMPSLFNAMAAGVVVTRVERSDGRPLPAGLKAELLQSAGASYAVAAAGVIVSLLPGVPFLPFAAVAAGLVAAAAKASPTGEDAETPAASATPAFRPLPDLRVLLPREILADPEARLATARAVDLARSELYALHGLPLPPPEFGQTAGDEGPVMEVKGVRCPGLSGGATPADPAEIHARFVEGVLGMKSLLIDNSMTRRLIELHEREMPDLIDSVIDKDVLDVTRLTMLLRSLSDEGVSLRNFGVILQAVAEAAPKAGGGPVLLEEVRIALAPVISAAVREAGVSSCVRLSPERDMAVARAEREDVPVPFEVVAALDDELRSLPPGFGVLVTSRASRAFVRDLPAVKEAGIRVYAYEEIGPAALTVVGYSGGAPRLAEAA